MVIVCEHTPDRTKDHDGEEGDDDAVDFLGQLGASSGVWIFWGGIPCPCLNTEGVEGSAHVSRNCLPNGMHTLNADTTAFIFAARAGLDGWMPPLSRRFSSRFEGLVQRCAVGGTA